MLDVLSTRFESYYIEVGNKYTVLNKMFETYLAWNYLSENINVRQENMSRWTRFW